MHGCPAFGLFFTLRDLLIILFTLLEKGVGSLSLVDVYILLNIEKI